MNLVLAFLLTALAFLVGIEVASYKAEAPVVKVVDHGSPADKAGIKTGDVIIEIAGKKIQNSHELMRIVAALTVGEKVTVKILRDGKEKTLSAVVGERKEEKEIARKSTAREYHGMAVQEITPDMAKHLGLSEKGGVIISQIRDGSPADDAGLKVQDIILQINRVKISSMKDFQSEIKKESREGTILLLIKRGEMSFFVTLRKGASK